MGDCVGYRSFEEGEVRAFFYRLVSGGAVLFGGVVEVQMHLPVEGVEELLAALAVVQLCEVEGVSVWYGSVDVVVVGAFV